MKYFTITELTKTATGLPNTPPEAYRLNLINLVDKVLDSAREALKMPITVSSGYRSSEVNRRAGGATNSQHLYGEAADVKCADNKRLFDWIVKNVPFDQIIWEFGNELQPQWVHVSLKRTGVNRKKKTRALRNEKGQVYYVDIK